MDNRARLDFLFQQGLINLDRGRLFDYCPGPKPATFDFDNAEGMLLGVAIGDALGITSEGMFPAERRACFGEVRDYIPNRYVDEARGFPSDDTQLTFWTLEQLIADKGFVPENVAHRIANSGRIFGIGRTVRDFLANFKAGTPWYKSGPKSAGNGAIMRIAPMLIPHLRTGGSDLWVDTALSAMITHNDRSSTSACLAFVAMLWELLDRSGPPDSRWWVARYVELARDIEGDAHYTPRGGQFMDYRGPLWRFVEEKLAWAMDRDLSVADACGAWWSGAFMLETVPSVLYILSRHAHDPEEAIVRAVNDTKDNDSIAAVVGAAVGALHGRKALPQRWIENLSGRTTDRDDGRVFALIKEARTTFWA